MYPQSLQMYACILHRVCSALLRETRATRVRIVANMAPLSFERDVKGTCF